MYTCNLPGKVLSMHALNHLTQHFLHFLNEGRNDTTKLNQCGLRGREGERERERERELFNSMYVRA